MNPKPVQLETTRINPQRSDSPPVTQPPEPAPAASASVAPLTAGQVAELEEKVISALRTCFDPEVPVNIYELGLIYHIAIDEQGAVQLRMTLTSPMCPVAGSLPPEVEAKVRAIPGVTAARVDLVWDPPWDKSRMTEAARLQLGLFD